MRSEEIKNATAVNRLARALAKYTRAVEKQTAALNDLSESIADQHASICLKLAPAIDRLASRPLSGRKS